MAAMRVMGPPHCGQVVRSMANTRLSNCAQLMQARVEAVEESLLSLEEAVAWSGLPGTIWKRKAALGARETLALPPNVGTDSVRLYQPTGEKTEEMTVQLFRRHYTRLEINTKKGRERRRMAYGLGAKLKFN